MISEENLKIIGLGIDSVEIDRFAAFQKLPVRQLNKVFADDEINYCLQVSSKTNERFAGYFAAKEAAYKALGKFLKAPLPLSSFCKLAQVTKNQYNAPALKINWSELQNYLNEKKAFKCLVSITHTKTTATAIVIIIDENQIY